MHGDPANTSLVESGLDAEAVRREVFALRGLTKASNPDHKLLELRGSKVAHLLKNAAVSAVKAGNRHTAARFQGITSGSKQTNGARARGGAEA